MGGGEGGKQAVMGNGVGGRGSRGCVDLVEIIRGCRDSHGKRSVGSILKL